MPKRAPLSVTPANPWVKILYPGTHTSLSGKAVTFTPADVSARVDSIKAQLATGYMPPAVVGHPRHDSPRVASVVDVKLQDGAAYLRVDELTPEFAESCRKGEYKYNSPAFYADGRLRHLGILGGWNSAMKDQPALEFGEGMFAESDAASGCTADDVQMFGCEADWCNVAGGFLSRLVWTLRSLGSNLRSQREALIEKEGVEAADKAMPDWTIKELESLEAPDLPSLNSCDDGATPSPAFGDGTSSTPVPAPAATATPPAAVTVVPATPGLTVPSPREAELQAQLEATKKQLTAIQAEAAGKAFGERLDKAADEGRMSPVLRGHLEHLYADFTSGDLVFGEGDPIPANLERIIDALPQIVAFGELGLGQPPASSINPLAADALSRHPHPPTGATA